MSSWTAAAAGEEWRRRSHEEGPSEEEHERKQIIKQNVGEGERTLKVDASSREADQHDLGDRRLEDRSRQPIRWQGLQGLTLKQQCERIMSDLRLDSRRRVKYQEQKPHDIISALARARRKRSQSTSSTRELRCAQSRNARRECESFDLGERPRH